MEQPPILPDDHADRALDQCPTYVPRSPSLVAQLLSLAIMAGAAVLLACVRF